MAQQEIVELPKGWNQSQLKELFDFVIGGDWGKLPEYDDFEFLEALCIRGSEFRNWSKDKGKTASLRKIKKASLTKRKLEEGDLLIEISGGGPEQPVGRTVLIDNEVLSFNKDLPKVCTNFLRLARPNNKINSKYLNYYLVNFYNSGEISKYQSGSNNLRNLKFKEYETINIPVAPLLEQKRIVKKLDSLLAQVDTIQQRLNNLPDIIKRFRQSVLAAAVSGKLTEQWRGSKATNFMQSPITIGQSKALAPKGWEWQKLLDLAILESGHTPRKTVEKYWDNGDVYWICLQDIRAAHGTIIKDTKYKPTMLGIENSSARLLPAGTVCFSRDISVGFTTIMGHEMSTTQHFANWICGDGLINKYLMFSLMAAKTHITNSGQGTTVKTVYMPALKEFRLLTPPLSEQTEIVRLVEQYFALADTLEKNLANAKQRVDNLTQSILAKAFRGELVPQDPNDEPADKLLARIKAARLEAEKLEKAAKKAAKASKK